MPLSRGVKVSLPTVFDLSTDGMIANMTDMNRLKANVNLKARTYQSWYGNSHMLNPSLITGNPYP